jgi:hypothetical protein
MAGPRGTASLQLGDDLAGDVVVEARPAERRALVFS